MSGGVPDQEEEAKEMIFNAHTGKFQDDINQKVSIGPEKCPKCGANDSVYAGGYCFKCGTHFPGGKKYEAGGHRDAYDYLQMTYGTRIANAKWMRNS